MTEWPDWWNWELELSLHLLKRMLERNFSETDLRLMMELAISLRKDEEPGRWIVETKHAESPWQVIVEPDSEEGVLVSLRRIE